MSDTEKVYEMLWDCAYCGTTKLLGKTHRHCPVCGAAQDPAARYFPSDEEKVAVEDHVYAGPDRTCGSCQAPNSAKSRFCGECGAPLEEADAVKLVEEEAAAKRASPAPRQRDEKGNKRKKLWLIVASLVALIIAVVLVAVFWTQKTALVVSGHSWKREIQILDYAPRSRKEWCDQMPRDATMVSRSEEIRKYNEIPDGQDCRTVKKDRGDGTFVQKQECTTKYRKEPVYDQKCSFKVNRWEHSRTVTEKGDSVNETPKWPTVDLKNTGQVIGAEKKGKQSETYTVRFNSAQGNAATCEFPQNTWQTFRTGTKWKGETGVLTGTLDCASLKSAGR